jgi:hypothetical protein
MLQAVMGAGWKPDEVNEFSSISIILLAALGPGVTQVPTEMSIGNRKKCLLGVERGWCVRLTTSPPSVS